MKSKLSAQKKKYKFMFPNKTLQTKTGKPGNRDNLYIRGPEVLFYDYAVV